MRVRAALVALVLAGLVVRLETAAATYYISATAGDDARSCGTAQTISTPKQHFRSAIGCLLADDTLYARGGTYTDSNDRIDSNLYTIPTGTAGHPITIASYPGETATIQHPDGTAGIQITGPSVHAYLIFQNLVVDGINGTNTGISAIVYLSQGQHDIHFLNLEVKNGWVSGYNIYSSGVAESPYNQVIGGSIHGNGRSGIAGGSAIGGGGNYGYGLYLDTVDTLVDGVDIYQNGGYGIQAIGDRNILRNNTIHDNGTWGGTNYGIDLGAGIYPSNDSNQVYNNVIWNNHGGILVYTNTSNAHVYQNTIYHNTPLEGIRVEFTKPGVTTLRNNIIYLNGVDTPYDAGGNSGSITQDHNGTSCAACFTDASRNDFSLTGTSGTNPAIDSGANTGITTDILGTSRPQGGGYDLGAYEQGSGAASPPIISTALVLPSAQTGTIYSQQVCATGGVPPYTWTKPSGAYPAGTTGSTLTSTCMTISGTLTTVGAYSMGLLVTDSSAQTDSGTFTMSITAALTTTCSGGLGAWTLITDACAQAGSANGTAAATTSGVTTTGGDIAFCAVANGNYADPIPVTDSKSNTWLLLPDPSNLGYGQYSRVAIYYSRLTSVGASHTFTADSGGVLSYPSIQCAVFRGSKSSPLDITATGAGQFAATMIQTSVMLPVQTWTLGVTALSFEDANVVALTGWTLYQQSFSVSQHYGVALGWAVNASTPTVLPVWSWVPPMSGATVAGTFLSAESYRPRQRFRRR